MKLACFNDYRIGVVRGDGLVDVTAAVQGVPVAHPGDRMTGIIERFASLRPAIEAAAASGAAIPLGQVKLLPPLPRPPLIDCMAVNYMEDGTLKEPAPINAFHKAPSAILGPGGTMVLPDVPASIFEGEAELALVIGKRASHVSQAHAMEHVFGYMNFIDGSARSLPPPGNTFFQMKSRDTFAPIGPWIVTADEIRDPQSLQIRLWVNGTLKQNFNSNDMAHKLPRLIEWLSSIHALEPGTIIATGTNHRGLNAFQDGDKIELEVEGCGRLAISVKDELKRTWSRDTRSEHAQKGGQGVHTPQLSGKYAPTAG
jgi:2-keto-4-pentenoate hydratase/2-oxohepta-3-ene-1,7-dioic acid hydratase in catechol pathway